MGTRLESSEPADRACACSETAVSVWLCVWDAQEHGWPLTQWSWICSTAQLGHAGALPSSQTHLSSPCSSHHGAGTHGMDFVKSGGLEEWRGFVGGMEQQHCPAVRLFLISF